METEKIDYRKLAKSPGEQATLSETPNCAEYHSGMRKEYDLEKCPHCKNDITVKETQAFITDF